MSTKRSHIELASLFQLTCRKNWERAGIQNKVFQVHCCFTAGDSQLVSFVSYLYLITCLLLHRKFGNIIHDIVQKYETVDVSQLRKLERISIKIAQAELDIRFLNNCKLYNVILKFLCFNLPGTNETDSRFVWKRLLRSDL